MGCMVSTHISEFKKDKSCHHAAQLHEEWLGHTSNNVFSHQASVILT